MVPRTPSRPGRTNADDEAKAAILIGEALVDWLGQRVSFYRAKHVRVGWEHVNVTTWRLVRLRDGATLSEARLESDGDGVRLHVFDVDEIT